MFAATKADHSGLDQHPNLVSLLQQMVHPAWRLGRRLNIST
ncbi:YcjX family protein [Vibrio lentus]|nr:YcjX family protein [Vibrio lentus]